ncbi:MAG: sigma-70 family RNA polymerase sigma factor [bacterium]|nr:sigma-70 family RNA polymerase sigma factor [bacterium]
MLENKSDKELIESFLAGNQDCYIELTERYTEKVFNLAFRFTRNKEDAEEVIQDVFITLHRKAGAFEGKSAFSSWLYRITVNTALMLIRKRKQTPAISIEEVSPQVKETWTGDSSANCNVDYISTQHELRGALDQAIGKLPEEYRSIFLMRDVDGLSNQEVGEVLGMSVPAVKSRLHRARLMLRRKLEKFYLDYVSTDKISYGSAVRADQFDGYLMAA